MNRPDYSMGYTPDDDRHLNRLILAVGFVAGCIASALLIVLVHGLAVL